LQQNILIAAKIAGGPAQGCAASQGFSQQNTFLTAKRIAQSDSHLLQQSPFTPQTPQNIASSFTTGLAQVVP